MTPTVSVIIRAKNEEHYIKACLEAVLSQTRAPEEIIILDNESKDATVQIASTFPISKILTISSYSPGGALNSGIINSTGDVLVFLSAHCIPSQATWLQSLLDGFSKLDPGEIVGVYGRQVPVSYSHPQDQRDLYAVFGEEDRIQSKDSFFHNANSAILRTAWEDAQFDEETAHIEDRIWARKMLAKGKKIFYSSSAEVYHWNGLHSSSDLKRSSNSIGILRRLGVAKEDVPDFLRPDKVTVLPIIPTSVNRKLATQFAAQLKELSSHLSGSKFLLEPILVTDSLDFESPANERQVLVQTESDSEISIEEALQAGLADYERNGGVPDFVLYANPEYVGRSDGIFEELLYTILASGSDTVFYGYEDLGHYWSLELDGEWKQSDDTLAPRELRARTFRALYGLGTISRASVVRAGSLVGKGTSIIPIDEFHYEGLSRFRKNKLVAKKSSSRETSEKQIDPSGPKRPGNAGRLSDVFKSG